MTFKLFSPEGGEMGLTKQQIASLLKLVAATESDELDCDGCLEHLAEFAERQLANRDVTAALQSVESHLRQCTCCQDEYQALLEGLRALDDND